MKQFCLNSESQADSFAWDSQSRSIHSHLSQPLSSWMLHGTLTSEAGMCCPQFHVQAEEASGKGDGTGQTDPSLGAI